MKTLACKDFGIKCDHVAKGDTANEVIENTSEHFKDKHPGLWIKIHHKSQVEIEKDMIPKIKEIV